MAVAVVVFNGTRLNDSDSNTGWGNYNASGGAPASEFPLAYQVTTGTTTGAVNKKINSSSQRQGVDFNGSSVDFTQAANKLWFCKVYISDSFDLNATWGVEIAIGSGDTANYHQYNVAGSGANLSAYSEYPAQGGYLITSIDPNIDTWREAESGTYSQAATVWYAVGAQFINGTAKTENVAMDAIDYGTGLTITAGDGASTEGNFRDFVATDQGNKVNRWGVVTGSGDIIRANGILTIGTAAVTEFLDNTSIVLFPDGYHSRGLVGIAIGNSHASSIFNIGCTFIGEGTRNGVDADDTRPDWTVTGTSGTNNFTGEMRNFRDVTFQSVDSVSGARIECMLLVQNSSDISDTTITTRSLVSVATLQDPTFGVSSDLHDCTFVQGEAGHAIEIATAGNYTLTNLFFTGYGTTGNDDAALDLTDTTGTYNITVSGGSTPSYKTGGATVNIISGTVTTTINVDDNDGNNLNGARVLVRAAAGGPEPHNDVVTIARAGTVATVTHTAHGFSVNDEVQIKGITDKTEDNVIQTITTVPGVDSYTYTTTDSGSTSYTGTILATAVFINDVTAGAGTISDTRAFASNQPISGFVRKSTSSPRFKTFNLAGNVIDSSTGLTVTIRMILDE
jgi:hypothetical protein